MSHLKFRVMATLAIFTLVAALATPMAAAQAAHAQQSGDFCKGLEARVFSPENPLPASAPCDASAVTRYTLVEPWRAGCEGSSTDPDCNVGFRMTDSWARIREWLTSHKFDRGSVWANPKEVVAPPAGATPEATPQPTAAPTEVAPTGPGGFSWGWCLWPLVLAGLILGGIWLWRRRRAPEAPRPAAPRPPAPPAPPAAPAP